MSFFDTVLGRTKAATRTLQERLTSVQNRARIAIKDRQDAPPLTGPTVAERQGSLLSFYAVYEEMVELLVDASQFGPQLLESKYAALRPKFLAGYAEVRPFALAYLRFRTEDDALGLELTGSPADAFEALVAAPELTTWSAMDDGLVIDRMHRTRQALTLYAEHLRHLVVVARDEK